MTWKQQMQLEIYEPINGIKNSRNQYFVANPLLSITA